MSDETPTLEETVHEIDMLRYEHGMWGACVVYLRRHTDARAWVRFALFVAAYGLLWAGYTQLTYYSAYGMVEHSFTGTEAHVATLVTVAVMAATWKGLEHVLE